MQVHNYVAESYIIMEGSALNWKVHLTVFEKVPNS